MNARQSFLFNDSSSIMSAASPAVRRESSRYANRLRDSISLAAGHHQVSDQSLTLTNMSSVILNDSQASTTLLGGSSLSLSRSGHNMTAVAEEEEEETVQVAEEVCGTLYQQFLEGQLKHHIEDDVFDLLKEYEGICSDHLQVLDQLKQQRTKKGSRFDDTVVSDETLRMLQLERNSWRLTRSLYYDRIRSPPDDQEMLVDETRILSDRQVIDLLYERNSKIRQMQLITDCLEQNFLDDMQRIEKEENIHFFSEGPHYWENTLHQANGKRLKVWQQNESVRMDPDAMFRNPAEIHELDKEDESRVMRFVFRYIRCGQLQTGKDLAHKLGFHWLSAALEGWILHHDANVNPDENMQTTDKMIPDGNSRRDLWKYACWCAASHTKNMSLFEKAIFGSLSGNVAAALPACPTWQDKLWAFTRASIDAQIEQELRNCQEEKPASGRTGSGTLMNMRASVDLSTEFWSNAKSMEEIFREIDGLLADYEWGVEEKIHFLIQKYIVTEDIDAALETMAVFIRTTSSDEDGSRLFPQIIRFFAHFALFYRSIGLIVEGCRQSHYNTILEAYIKYLIDKRHITLVASYVSKLPKDMQIYTYSKLLTRIKDKGERKRCLTLAKEAGLDVDDMTKSVVQSLRDTTQPSASASVLHTTSLIDASLTGINKIEDDDAQLINSLEWLSIGTVQYMEILKQGNALMRYFILSGKMEAAKELFRRLPTDLMEGVQRSWKRKSGSADYSLELKNLMKEFICLQSFFAVMESFSDWSHYYRNARPRQPEKPKGNKFTEKVAFDHMSRVYESELQTWKSVLSKQAKMTADKIHMILLCDGGWMRDSENKTTSHREQDVSRAQELASLRKRFIPELTFLLHTVLHLSGRHRDCMRIADTIASEEYQLHSEFTTDQLQDLMHKLRDAAIDSLSVGNDALGYPDAARASNE